MIPGHGDMLNSDTWTVRDHTRDRKANCCGYKTLGLRGCRARGSTHWTEGTLPSCVAIISRNRGPCRSRKGATHLQNSAGVMPSMRSPPPLICDCPADRAGVANLAADAAAVSPAAAAARGVPPKTVPIGA